jgi:hypothetical protein
VLFEIGDGRADIRLKVFIEDAFAGVVQFLRERLQVFGLVGGSPINAEAGALRQHGVDHHDRAAIAIEKRMAVRQIAHDLTGLSTHGLGIVAEPQSMLDSVLNVLGMGEQNAAPAHGDVRRRGGAILPGPGVHGLEEQFVSVEHVGVGRNLLFLKGREGVIDARRKGGMFQPPYDRGVFLLGKIA